MPCAKNPVLLCCLGLAVMLGSSCKPEGNSPPAFPQPDFILPDLLVTHREPVAGEDNFADFQSLLQQETHFWSSAKLYEQLRWTVYRQLNDPDFIWHEEDGLWQGEYNAHTYTSGMEVSAESWESGGFRYWSFRYRQPLSDTGPEADFSHHFQTDYISDEMPYSITGYLIPNSNGAGWAGLTYTVEVKADSAVFVFPPDGGSFVRLVQYRGGPYFDRRLFDNTTLSMLEWSSVTGEGSIYNDTLAGLTKVACWDSLLMDIDCL